MHFQQIYNSSASKLPPIELLCEINDFASENVVRFIVENSFKRLRIWRLKTVRRTKLLAALTSDDRCAIGMAWRAQLKNKRQKKRKREEKKSQELYFRLNVDQSIRQPEENVSYVEKPQLDSPRLSLPFVFIIISVAFFPMAFFSSSFVSNCWVCCFILAA